MPGAADERPALAIFIGPGRFADEHQFGLGAAFAEDDVVAAFGELAALAVAQFFAHRFQAVRRGDGPVAFRAFDARFWSGGRCLFGRRLLFDRQFRFGRGFGQGHQVFLLYRELPPEIAQAVQTLHQIAEGEIHFVRFILGHAAPVCPYPVTIP
ncbi:MAG: hypothetical protein ACTSXZ_11255 [Alphaproteobacteria bacterium]